MEIFGVDIDRKKNLEFQNYSYNEEELGVLRFEFNEREIPEEYQEMLKDESEVFTEAMEEIDDNFKSKDDSFNAKVKKNFFY